MLPKQPCGNEPAHHVTDAREQRGAHLVPGARKQVHAQPSNCQVEQDRKIKAERRIRRYSENQESRCQLGMYRVDQPSHASRPQWIPQRKMALTQLSPGVQPSRQQGIQNIRSFLLPDIYAFTRAIQYLYLKSVL